MGEKSKSGVCDEIELVVHGVADSNGRPAHQFDVLHGAGVVYAKRPFAIFIEGKSNAADASASWSRADALQAYGFEFLDGFLSSVHSALLGYANAMAGARFQQGSAA